MSMKSMNPNTGKMIAEYRSHDENKLDSLLEKATEAYRLWKQVSVDERADLAGGAAAILQGRKEELSRLMTTEMGKPIGQSRSEVEKCAWLCSYYAEHAAEFLKDRNVDTDASNSFVTYQPLGPVLAVMPWNFPLWQVFRFAIPGLIAGNVGLLKHASNVPGCAVAIESVFIEAGFPEHAFTNLFIDKDQVRRAIEGKHVKAVTLTGSTGAGKSIASISGGVVKKTVLELGGSDPYIILEDADLESAVTACVESRLINSGQSCIAAKRFIVVQKRAEEFVERFIDEMKSKIMDDPMLENTDVGPMARQDLRDGLHRQVLDSVAAGADIKLGGDIPAGDGFFYPPTILTDVTKGMPAFDDELFGPVAAVSVAPGEEEAIAMANDSDFGLGAAVFTGNSDRGAKIAREMIAAGSCFVNTYVRSDPRLPFGGIGQSGYGRELSEEGIREFTNVKTVYIK